MIRCQLQTYAERNECYDFASVAERVLQIAIVEIQEVKVALRRAVVLAELALASVVSIGLTCRFDISKRAIVIDKVTILVVLRQGVLVAIGSGNCV